MWILLTGAVNVFLLLNPGVPDTLTHLISEACADGDQDRAAEYFSSAFWVASAVTVLTGTIAFLLWNYVDWPTLCHISSKDASGQTRKAVGLTIILLLCSLPAGLANRTFAGYQELHVSNCFRGAGGLLSLIIVCIALRYGVGLSQLVASYAGPVVLAELASLVWLVGYYKPWIRPRPARARVVHIHRIMRPMGLWLRTSDR
ncbi:MAG: hypothetical protein ACRYGF_13935 [Janthinobacterium lividum]